MKRIKFTKSRILLIIIVCIAAVVRLYNLSNVPPHLTSDEAALGYNAYSILKTGRDEHGTFLPIIFKSFGDNKPGLYVYLTVPFVAIFGLTELSTRLASALCGILAVYIIFKLSERLFVNIDKKIAYLSAFMLALSPWHIQFSRGAWEVNVALTLTLMGIYFFIRSLQFKRELLLSALFFALTFLTYQGAKLSTTIVVVILFILWGKDIIIKNSKNIIRGGLLGLMVISPIVISLFTGQAGRLSVFSVFSAPRPEAYLHAFLREGSEERNSVSYYLFHSESLNFARGILGRWFNHFSGRFLFFEGDWQNPRHSAPYVGMLLLADIPLLLCGLFVLSRLKDRRISLLVFLWLILSPLPAILSRDQVHAVRSFNMVIPFVFISSLGASFLLRKLNNNISWIIILVVYVASFVYYLDAYFVHLPKRESQYWEYGYRQAVQEITPIQGNYKKIIFQQSYSQPYIFFLFYQKYDPHTFQSFIQSHFIESLYGDVGQVDQLDNIYFTGIDWQVLRGDHKTLVVGDSERIPEGDSKEGTEFHVIKTINYLNGTQTALRIIEIK